MPNTVTLRPPVVGVIENPMVGLPPSAVRAVDVSSLMLDHAPQIAGTWIGYYNEDIVLRADWHLVPLMPGDRVVFVNYAQGKDVVRGFAFVAVAFLSWGASLYVSAAYGAVAGFAAGLAVSIVGGMVVNSLLPMAQRAGTGGAGARAASVYSSALSGNVSKLDMPVWKTVGRRKITPPFASQPYFSFREKPDPDDTGDNSDQYYYALFAIGVGDHEIELEQIGLTTLQHFADIEQHNYLPPGTAPTFVNPAVTTSSEVSGIELDTNKFTNAYTTCLPTRRIMRLGIDVVAPQGLGKADNTALSVSWRVECRDIDDFGTPQTSWGVLGSPSYSANTATVQRWSQEYDIPVHKRKEVRLIRTDTKNTDPGARHSIQWVGMRSYLDDPAPLNPAVAHYEIVMRSSEQLNSNTQTQFGVTLTAKTRSLDSGLNWQAAAANRNGAWALLDLATSPVWGLAFPDATIDLQSFYDIAQVATVRQDRCDFTFSDAMDGWDAMQLLARTMRARVFRRNGLLTIARDEWVDLPVAAFTPRNTMPGSMSLHENLATRETPDGVIIEYEDYRTFLSTPMEIPCPGYSSTNSRYDFYNPALPAMSRPVRKSLDGITGPTHAKREGLYEAYSLTLRRSTVNCITELQGIVPAFMSPVIWQPELKEYGQSGDVVDFDEATSTLTLSEPVEIAAEPVFIMLVRDDGTVTAPSRAFAGPTAKQVVMATPPDFTLVCDSSQRERPQFVTAYENRELIKISSISDGGKSDAGAQLYAIAGTVDDQRVHTVDNYLLSVNPQDLPVYLPFEDSASVALYNAPLWSDGFLIAGPTSASLRFYNTGTAQWLGVSLADHLHPLPRNDGPTSIVTPGMWAVGGPIEVSIAKKYEIRFTYVGGFGSATFASPFKKALPPNIGDPVDVWHNLGTDRTVGRQNTELYRFAITVVKVEIREALTKIVQAEGTMTFINNQYPGDGGIDGDDSGGDGDAEGEGDGGDGA